MSLEDRYGVAPQMQDYDRIGMTWMPYLMETVTPSQQLRSLSTDLHGLRNTLARDGRVVSVDSIAGIDSPVGVLLGSSAVFGVGSTSDRQTIPSALNRLTNTTWLNFGGRGFNSTQEVILFLLHVPKKLDRLVLFSGANNPFLTFVSQPSAVYNSLFSRSVFERALAHPPETYIGVRKAFRTLLRELEHRFMPKEVSSPVPDFDDAYGKMMICFRRDLRVLRAVADGLGVPLNFALQPVATWLDKRLAPEEEKLFDILDSLSINTYQLWAKQIRTLRDRYFADVSELCNDLSVRFCNVNLAPEFSAGEWLFVDRIHLTDRGCEVAAKVLREEFSL